MTEMGRETSLAKDQGQARLGTSGMLNPRNFDAMMAAIG